MPNCHGVRQVEKGPITVLMDSGAPVDGHPASTVEADQDTAPPMYFFTIARMAAGLAGFGR